LAGKGKQRKKRLNKRNKLNENTLYTLLTIYAITQFDFVLCWDFSFFVVLIIPPAKMSFNKFQCPYQATIHNCFPASFEALESVQNQQSHLQVPLSPTAEPVSTKSSVINTLRTGDADLRFYITTVQDG